MNRRVDSILAVDDACAALYAGDRTAATQLYSRLSQERDPGLAGPLSNPTGTEHVLALLANLIGRTDESRAHFERSVSALGHTNQRPWLAWVEFDYAEFLLRDSRPLASSEAERSRALSLQNESLAIARELGLKPLIEQVIARKKVLGA